MKSIFIHAKNLYIVPAIQHGHHVNPVHMKSNKQNLQLEELASFKDIHTGSHFNNTDVRTVLLSGS